MKARARRVTLAAAVLGAGVVIGLAIAHWSAIRDHIKAWHFYMTTEVETLLPDAAKRGMTVDDPSPSSTMIQCLQFIADHSGRPVIFEASESVLEEVWTTTENPLAWQTSHTAIQLLRGDGWCIIEQQFPRAAYVILEVPSYSQEEFPLSEGDTVSR